MSDKKIILEIHADGVKEIEEKDIDKCPFCVVPCNQPHCVYTEEE